MTVKHVDERRSQQSGRRNAESSGEMLTSFTGWVIQQATCYWSGCGLSISSRKVLGLIPNVKTNPNSKDDNGYQLLNGSEFTLSCLGEMYQVHYRYLMAVNSIVIKNKFPQGNIGRSTCRAPEAAGPLSVSGVSGPGEGGGALREGTGVSRAGV